MNHHLEGEMRRRDEELKPLTEVIHKDPLINLLAREYILVGQPDTLTECLFKMVTKCSEVKQGMVQSETERIITASYIQRQQ